MRGPVGRLKGWSILPTLLLSVGLVLSMTACSRRSVLVGAIPADAQADAAADGRARGRDGSSRDAAGADAGDGSPRDAAVDAVAAIDGASRVCLSTELPIEEIRTEVDVLFAVDGSASMDSQIEAVEAGLSDFVLSITQERADVRILLVSRTPDHENGICIPVPLGNGDCIDDDSNPPRYVHATGSIGGLAFTSALGNSKYEQYEAYLREDSDKHFVLVTDHGGSSWDSVESLDEAVLDRDPRFEGYRFHAIIPRDEACGEVTSDAYEQLAAKTGGLTADLCAPDFTPLFELLREQVSENATSCRWVIPLPPSGMQFDRGRVNFDIVASDGSESRIGFVTDLAECDQTSDGQGWYYDDPDDPREMNACPTTCTSIRRLDQGQLSIEFGCMAQVATLI